MIIIIVKLSIQMFSASHVHYITSRGQGITYYSTTLKGSGVFNALKTVENDQLEYIL